MLAVISPSKNLNESPVRLTGKYTYPRFINESAIIVEKLKTLSPARLQKLMNINRKLAELNFQRYQEWSPEFTEQNADRAILMFSGEVYNGLQAKTLKEEDLLYAQERVRILSGLYGILRPLDLMQPYRLEMATSIVVNRKKDLYRFWGDRITRALYEDMDGHKEKVLINLASDEYFNSIDSKKPGLRIIKCQFKEERNGRLQFITIFGKKARGLMLRFMIENRLENPDDLKAFDTEGYYFNSHYSTEDMWMFTR